MENPNDNGREQYFIDLRERGLMICEICELEHDYRLDKNNREICEECEELERRNKKDE